MASTVSAPAAVGPASTMADENAVNSNAPGVPPSNAAAAVVADKAPAKKKRNKKKRALITPTKNNDPRMTVEKGVVDELLLVCGVIGTTTNEGNELVPVTDCLNWLQDLQRALRRDDDQFRPISLLIGKWNVVQQKLLPLVMTCRYDTAIVLTVVKILVILTKPLAENTKRAGRMIIDTSSNKKNDPAVIAEQIKLRDNALEQAEMLMEYKRAVAHHSSHRTQSGSGLLSVLVSLLAAPLSKTGASRTDADHLTIELVLHLIRNLLSAEPLLNSKFLSLLFLKTRNGFAFTLGIHTSLLLIYFYG
jgi:timeless